MKIKISAIIFCLFFCGLLKGQEKVQLASPDGCIVFSLLIRNGKPQFTVAYKKQLLIHDSQLGISLDDGKPLEKCSMKQAPEVAAAVENYQLIVGKKSLVNHPYKKGMIYFQGVNNKVNLEVKLFNDGLAFRYVFPTTTGKQDFTLLDETTQFNLTGNPVVKALLLPNFTSSHEGLYTTAVLNGISNDTLMDMPALFQFPNHIFMAITEAALLDYAGMYLIKHHGILTSQLSPLPGQQNIKVKAKLPHQSPWRVMLIGDRIGTLIESNILSVSKKTL